MNAFTCTLMARVNEDKYLVDFYYINVKHRYNMQNITTKETIIGIGGILKYQWVYC